MSNLGDYIGQILTEITVARAQADIEAVRLADMYATHPLLKTFPVPRFRLPTVSISVPVAVSDAQAQARSGPLRSGPSPARMRKALETTLEEQFKNGGLKLGGEEQQRLMAALRERLGKLDHSESFSTSAVHVADAVVADIAQALSAARPDAAEREQFIADLRQAARVALVKLLPTPPRVRVVSDTAQLRELGAQEFLMRLQINITEQGVEWRGEDAGGKRLLPE